MTAALDAIRARHVALEDAIRDGLGATDLTPVSVSVKASDALDALLAALDRAEAEFRDLLAIVEDDNDRSFHDCQCNWHLNLEAAKRRARAALADVAGEGTP